MDIIFEGQRHNVSFRTPLNAKGPLDRWVMLDGESTVPLRECLGHPNPLFRTIFAIYIEENRHHSAFKFCCVPPLEKVGGVWQ